jgi:hypothetical protein
VIHASLRGLLAGVFTPTALVVLGGGAIIDGGLRPFPSILLVSGLVIGAVVLADLPRRVEFDRTGLTRVCWLRRQRIAWSDVVAIERSRPSTTTIARNVVDRRTARREEPVVSGGLLARGSGRRRWLLTDRVESRSEHADLTSLLEEVEPPVVMRAPQPHDAAPPTDLYRRRRRGSTDA